MASQCVFVPRPVRVLFVESCVQGYRPTRRETGSCVQVIGLIAVPAKIVSRRVLNERRWLLSNHDLFSAVNLVCPRATLWTSVSWCFQLAISSLSSYGHSLIHSLRKKTNTPELKQLGFNF